MLDIHAGWSMIDIGDEALTVLLCIDPLLGLHDTPTAAAHVLHTIHDWRSQE